MVETPGGYNGPWSPELTPYMVEPLDTVNDRNVEATIFVGPAQSGKSFALIGGTVAYSSVVDPGDDLIVQMSGDTARDFSRKELDRWIRSSPKIVDKLSRHARDDNTFDKFWANGAVLKIGWPAISQLSSKALRRVLLTDYDRYPDDIDGEGDAFTLALTRVRTYRSKGMVIAESSPGRDIVNPKWRPSTAHEAPPCGGILGLYNTADRRRWYWPCPHCGFYFQARPGVEAFLIPSEEVLIDAIKTSDIAGLVGEIARIACPACAQVIEESSKITMNAAAIWVPDGMSVTENRVLVGQAPQSNRRSYWLAGVAAAYNEWSKMVRKYLEALRHYIKTGENNLLKSCENVDFAMPHRVRGIKVEDNMSELQERCEPWRSGTVPAGARFLTASVDVQDRRFVVCVKGWGPGSESWTIDRFDIKESARVDEDGKPRRVDPGSYGEDWELLVDAVVTRAYPLVSDPARAMPVKLTLIDSGGSKGVTGQAYKFWRALRKRGLAPKVRLIKGASRVDAPRIEMRTPDQRNRKDRTSGSAGDVPVWFLNGTSLKDTVAGHLARREPGPGYMHIPKDLGTDSFFSELTAEYRTASGWQCPDGVANEQTDLEAYNLAAAIMLGIETIDWSRSLASDAPIDGGKPSNDDDETKSPPPAEPNREMTEKERRLAEIARKLNR